MSSWALFSNTSPCVLTMGRERTPRTPKSRDSAQRNSQFPRASCLWPHTTCPTSWCISGHRPSSVPDLWNKTLTCKARGTSIWHHLVTKTTAFLEDRRGSDKAHEALSSNFQMPVCVCSQKSQGGSGQRTSKPSGWMTVRKPGPRTTDRVWAGISESTASVQGRLGVPDALLVLRASPGRQTLDETPQLGS